MDTISAAAVARDLGTTTPRVLRAVRRRGLRPARGDRGALLLSDADAQLLRGMLGVTVGVSGLSGTQTRVLAALARAPLGMRSTRAVARAAGLSPTAATAALHELHQGGLVETRRQTIADGKAREIDIVGANLLHPQWASLAPQLALIELRPSPRVAATKLPHRFAHVFWNAPCSQIDPDVHGAYIARRVLTDGDTQSLAWAAQALSAADWTAAGRSRGLSPRQRALAANLAAVAP